MLRAEKEVTSENLQTERNQLLEELESVRASLKALSQSNATLEKINKVKTALTEQ